MPTASPRRRCKARFSGGQVINDIAQGRLAHVRQQVAAEQVAGGGQDADRAFGVPGDGEHAGGEAVGQEVVPVLQQQVRREAVRLAKAR